MVEPDQFFLSEASFKRLLEEHTLKDLGKINSLARIQAVTSVLLAVLIGVLSWIANDKNTAFLRAVDQLTEVVIQVKINRIDINHNAEEIARQRQRDVEMQRNQTALTQAILDFLRDYRQDRQSRRNP